MHKRSMDLRLLTRAPVTCPVMFRTDWYIAEGDLINLSLPGCAIRTSRRLMLDEYVTLHLLLPKEGLRITAGKVRWSEKDFFGVEFLILTHMVQARISQTVTGYIGANCVTDVRPSNGCSG